MTLAAALVAFWWNSDKVKSIAIGQASHYCRQQELQLLDQSMVLRGIWPTTDGNGGVCLRRRYEFEFTSTGEARNRGHITMLGRQLSQLIVEAHILPDQDRKLH